MKRYLCSLVALGLLVGVTGRAVAQPSYSFTMLDVPGSSYAPPTHATGINASGQIVGWYQGAGGRSHSFLLDQGSYTTLDVPGSTGTSASGINDSGQIVGTYSDASGLQRPQAGFGSSSPFLSSLRLASQPCDSLPGQVSEQAQAIRQCPAGDALRAVRGDVRRSFLYAWARQRVRCCSTLAM